MAQLAIKGHATRGKEVIEILEMFGGRNDINYVGELPNYAYAINKHGIIDWHVQYEHNSIQYNTFTLEEFLKKFPYKVGDKVQHKGATSCGSVFKVEKMKWVGDHVEYTVKRLWYYNGYSTVTAEDLQPYKEETMEEKIESFEILESHCVNEVKIEFDPSKFEIVKRDDGYYVVKKQPQYPNTYEECCKVLGYNQVMPKDHILGYNGSLLSSFQQLLIYRNAYWKIAGKQIGLGKPWESDWGKADERKHCIGIVKGNMTMWEQQTTSKILAFPTSEMRDAFFENFKELIELCKELL